MIFLKLFSVFLLLTELRAQEVPDWKACPNDPGVMGPTWPNVNQKWECAMLNPPMDYSNSSSPKVPSFVRRAHSKKLTGPTNKALFIILGGPGISTSEAVPFCDAGFVAIDPTITCYLVDDRGIGLSWPIKSCEQTLPYYLNPYNETVMNGAKECLQDIMKDTPNKLKYVTTYHAAMDVKYAIDLTRSSGSTVSILGVSYGTYFVNTLMQLDGMKADVIVLDGPVTPNRWPMENNARMQSMVSLDSIRMCVNESSVCQNNLGVMGHIPQMVKDGIRDGSLPCIKKLPWLADKDASWFTSTYNNMFNPNGKTKESQKKLLLGPFWARLYRCSDSDAQQIQYFRDYVMNRYTYDPTKKHNTTVFQSYSLGYAINTGANEFYHFGPTAPLSYQQVVEYNEYSFIIEGGDVMSSLARNISWPSDQNLSSILSSFMKPTCPVHILVGNLDANTPADQAKWYKDGMGPTVNTIIHTVPYGAHGLIDYANTCAVEVFTKVLGLSSNVDFSCLQTMIPSPDWDGNMQNSHEISLEFFGTTDLWNNGFYYDQATPVTTTTVNYENCDDEIKDTVGMTLGISVAILVLFIGMALCIAVFYRKYSHVIAKSPTPPSVNIETKNVLNK